MSNVVRNMKMNIAVIVLEHILAIYMGYLELDDIRNDPC